MAWTLAEAEAKTIRNTMGNGQCGGRGTGPHAGSREGKALVVTLADIKAEVKAKTLGEMTGDLEKRALVGNGSHTKKSGDRDFSPEARRCDGQSTGLHTD